MSANKNEQYSSQTRQTRTALGVSSATLFIYSAYGTFEEDVTQVEYMSGQFNIPIDIIGPVLAITTGYFLFSFFISAVYDRMPILNRKISTDVTAMRRDLESFLERYERYKDAAPTHVERAIAMLEEAAKKISDPKLQTAINHLQDNTDFRHETTKARDIIRSISQGSLRKTAIATMNGDFEPNWQDLKGRFNQVERTVGALDVATKGVTSLKNFFLELLAPITGAIIALATFFIFGLDKGAGS